MTKVKTESNPVKEKEKRMKRPALNETPLDRARATKDSPSVNILIGPGEWDEWIQTSYDAGHTLIEFDESEKPVRAFRKTVVDLQPGLFKKKEKNP